MNKKLLDVQIKTDTTHNEVAER